MSHRYPTPAKGSDDWNVPLDNNFADLEIDVEYRGPDADKSDITPADGAKYLATDTATIYIGDGSNWTELGTIGSGGSGDFQNADIEPASVTQYDTRAPIEGSIIEGFEAGDISHYTGDTSQFDVVSSALQGDWMTEVVYPDVGGTTTVYGIQTDVVNTRRGETYSSFVRISSAGGSNSQGGPVILAEFDGSGNLTDGYQIRLNYESQELEILKWETQQSGTGFVNGSTNPVTVSNNTWYRIEADAEDDRISARLYDLRGNLVGQHTYVDSNEDSQPLANGDGYGWRTRCDTLDDTVAFDMLTKQAIAGTPNHVAVNSPDVGRIFIRDTDPANEYTVYDGYDYWIDTSQ